MLPEIYNELLRWRDTAKELPEPPEGYEDEEFAVMTIDHGGCFEIQLYDPVKNQWEWEAPLYWSRAIEAMPDMPDLMGAE